MPGQTILECCQQNMTKSIINNFKEVLTNVHCPPVDYGAWDSPGIGRYAFAMCLQGAVLFLITVLIDSSQYQAIGGKLKDVLLCMGDASNSTAAAPHSDADDEDEDEDVSAERDRIDQQDTGDDVVVIDTITKRYAGSWFGASHKAVDRLSFGVAKGTCFGLLGVNGAGKTSTFKMLTGDESITGGTAIVDGFDVKTNLSRARQRLGYATCYQTGGGGG